MDESTPFTTELEEERWFSLLSEGQHLQEKIATLLKRWHIGVGWTAQHQQELASLMYQRKRHAQEIGLYVLALLSSETTSELSLKRRAESQLKLFDDDPHEWFLEIQNRLQAPRELITSQDADNDFRRIEGVVNHIFTWGKRPPNLQVALLEQIAARLRYLQEETPASSDVQESVRKLFYKLTDYSKKHNPGFVHGMSLSHKPKEQSWKIDMRNSWKNILCQSTSTVMDVKLNAFRSFLQSKPSPQALQDRLPKENSLYSNGSFLRMMLNFEEQAHSIPELSEAISAFKKAVGE